MIYPDTLSSRLGFATLTKMVNDACASQPGRRAASEHLTFSADAGIVITRLRQVEQMQRLIAEGDPFQLGSLHDLTSPLASIRVEGTALQVDDLAHLNSTLESLASITDFFKTTGDESTAYHLLREIAEPIETFPSIRSTINRVIDRYGMVKDSASAELAEIRRSLASTTASLNSVMRRVMSRAVEGGYLDADSAPVMRSGRLVLPVSPMNKRKIPGIVHDESASGKTFYIEPAELVEANNRIRELQLEEKREINRILRQITDEIRPHSAEINQSVMQAGLLDFIRAKASVANATGGQMPHISDKPELEWYHAINPVLQLTLRAHGKEAVALNITLNSKQRLLIISGPNAGGKSVCLKTVGLIQFMLQSGLLPPLYENSHVGIFDNIFIDIGDDQSIEDDLSTYSSHLRNMNFFLRHASTSTLLLIDEFGTGTEPQIGGAIAQAILKQLNQNGAWGVITTHYQNLKTFADETPGLVNGSMLYDRQLMQPMFQLSVGNAGSSFALEIARKTGLPDSIIDDAKEIVGSDYVNTDKFLLDIARDRRYWENKRRDIRQKEKRLEELLEKYESDADSLRTQRRQIIASAKEEAEKIIAQSNASIERTIREIKESQADKERTRQARQELAEQRSKLLAENGAADNEPAALRKAPKSKRNKAPKATTTADNRPLQAGEHVKMDDGGSVGTIVSIEGKTAMVEFGAIKVKVDTSRLKRTAAKPKAQGGVAFVSSQTTDASRNRQLNFKQEIDLRGMRLDEALQQMVYYIDDAIQFNAGRVRVLHGTGTGALREGIRRFLRSHEGVESFRDELPQFGGAGITIVDLK